MNAFITCLAFFYLNLILSLQQSLDLWPASILAVV